MFADTLNNWELGLAPSPLFTAKKNQDDVFFNAIAAQYDQGNSTDGEGDSNLQLLPFEAAPPLELDIFERELKKLEAENNTLNEQSSTSTLIDDAFENNLAVIADPKMLMNDSGFESANSSALMEVEDTQNLIEEMESFLLQHEEEKKPALVQVPAVVPTGLDLLEQVMEEVEMMPVKEEAPADLSAQESEQAEAILDALIKGDLTTDFESSINNAAVEIVDETATTITTLPIAAAPVNSKPAKTPIFSGINNISEVITADGQKIVIVIANDMPGQVSDFSQIKAQVAASIPNIKAAPVVLQQSETEEDTSDSDWSPNSPAASNTKKNPVKGVTTGRIAKQRGPYSKRAHATVKDKKERKKLQNVEAARRYRDKKKSEQSGVETVEEVLDNKNKALKGQLSEMENELKTLKKLMTELGLVK